MEKLSPEQQERLQEYLETRKISKYRIAHDLNLSASTISNYLTGKTKPDGIKWELFRNYLGISEEWIRTGQNMVSTPHDETSPKKTPAPNSVEAAVEEIRLMFQTRRRPVYEPSQRFGKTIQNAARITDYPFRTTPQTEKIIQRHR